MVDQLNWESLELRRTNSTISMFYKIINNSVSVDFSNYIYREVFQETRGHYR